MKGKLVIIDGIDGSGKSVVVDALREWALDKGLKILDLREWWKENDKTDVISEDNPSGLFPDISDFDVIISCEMTYTGWGKKLREEMVKVGTKYTPEQIAKAFSEDRKELYKEVIIPALEKGKYIFQERGVVTSFVYQPIEGYPLEKVMELEGNKLVMVYKPDLLIITKVISEVAFNRLSKREKKDEAVFEELEFQRKAENVYSSDLLKKIFKETKIVYLDTMESIEETKKKSLKIWEEFK